MPPVRKLIALREAKPPFFVGIDLGGSSIKIGVVDDVGRGLSWLSIPTEVEQGPEDASRRIGQAVQDVIRDAGIKPSAVARVGFGSPGTLDVRGGKIINSSNLPGWSGFPLRDRVSHYCGLPVAFVNDASAAAYGEFWVGSGRAFHSMIFLTLGTGVGAGIIVGDVIVEGENGFGAECGHIIVDTTATARICSCGMPGHLEAYASAVAVVKRTQEAIDAGRSSSIGKRLAKGEALSPLVISQEAEAGDPFALEIIDETGRYLGLGIVSLVHTIDPSGVLIGGAMTFNGRASSIGNRFLDAVRAEFRKHTFPMLAEQTVIDFASLGSDAGFYGAAGLARFEHQKAEGY